MDNAQKAIMIGVGLFITIIIISAVLLIVNLGSDVMGQAGEEVMNMTDSLRAELYNKYDGKTLTKAEVAVAARTYQDSVGFGLVHIASDGKTLTYAGKKGLGFASVPKTLTVGGVVSDITATVGTLAKFLAALVDKPYTSAIVLDTNGNIVGLAFMASK